MKGRPLRNALYEFAQSHKTELNELKVQIKQITKENETLQTTIIENQESTKTLMKTIDKKAQEIKEYQKQQAQLKKENESLCANFDNLNNKLCALELLYDKNITELGKENVAHKRNIELQKIAHTKLSEEFSANRKDLQTKFDEKTAQCTAMQEQFLAAQIELKNSKEKAISLQDALEAYKLKSANELKENEQKVKQEYETKIDNLKRELEQKDKIIMQTGQEKDEVEKAKNKTIDELSYKIREIERVFGQPLNRVEPLSEQKTSPHKIVPVQQNKQLTTQPSTSALLNAATNSQRHTHTSNNALPEKHTTTQSTAANNLRSQRKRNYISASEASSDDDELSSGWGWCPNIVLPQNTEDTVKGEYTYGFGQRKRSLVYVPETSESDSVNQNTKRSRK